MRLPADLMRDQPAAMAARVAALATRDAVSGAGSGDPAARMVFDLVDPESAP